MCFFMLKTLKIVNITFSLKQNEESLADKTYCGELGTVMLLTRRADFEAKKLLKGSSTISPEKNHSPNPKSNPNPNPNSNRGSIF